MALNAVRDAEGVVAPRPLTAGHPAEHRITRAALRCIARWGVAKTTLDDIAREAGCSRATVYRTFPGGKDVVVDALVREEVGRFYGDLATRLDEADDLESLLVTALTWSYRTIRDHEALQFLLAHEPEVVLPRVAFGEYDRLLHVAVEFAAPWLVPHVGPEEAPRAAEWVVRLVVSYAMSPSERVDLGDESQARRLVRTYLLPGLHQSVSPVPQSPKE